MSSFPGHRDSGISTGGSYSNVFGPAPSVPEKQLDFPRIKILMLGNANVGKSCFVKRYCEDRFVTKYIPTIGIDYGVKTVPIRAAEVAKYKLLESTSNKDAETKKGSWHGGGSDVIAGATPAAVRINFWDVAGGSEALEIRNEFYGSAQGIFLMYDVRDSGSFNALDSWWEEASQYIPLVRGATPSVGIANSTTANTPAGKVVGNCGSVPPILILCANKVDQEPSNGAPFLKRAVSTEEGKAWANAHQCAGFYETSCSVSEMVTTPMEALVHHVVGRFLS